MHGKGVECEVEDRKGNQGQGVARRLEEEGGDQMENTPLVGRSAFEPCELKKSVGECGVFIAGWFVVIPLELAKIPMNVNKYPVDGVQKMGELMAAEINIGRENLEVALAYIFEHA